MEFVKRKKEESGRTIIEMEPHSEMYKEMAEDMDIVVMDSSDSTGNPIVKVIHQHWIHMSTFGAIRPVKQTMPELWLNKRQKRSPIKLRKFETFTYKGESEKAVVDGREYSGITSISVFNRD